MAGGVLCYICSLRVLSTLKLWGKAIPKRSVLIFSGVNFGSAVLSVKVSSTGLVSQKLRQFTDLSLCVYCWTFLEHSVLNDKTVILKVNIENRNHI